MDYRKKISNTIRKLLNTGEKNVLFAIYPFGEQGQLTKQILSLEYGIDDVLVIDNRLCEFNKNIKSLEDLSKIDCSKYLFLLVSDNENIYAEIRVGIAKYVNKDRIIDVLSTSPYLKNDEYFVPPVYSDPRFAAWELCAKEIYINNIPGAVAEAGVHKGHSARMINRLFCDRKLYLFDTFEGFDTRDIKHDIEQGFSLFNANPEDYLAARHLSGTDEQYVMSKMAYPNNVIIRKGWFPDTAAELEDEYCFVSLDMDLYKPIYTGLEYFYPRLNSGGYIFIHDYKSETADWAGCGQAVRDYCNNMKIGYIPVSDSLFSKNVSAVITK